MDRLDSCEVIYESQNNLYQHSISESIASPYFPDYFYSLSNFSYSNMSDAKSIAHLVQSQSSKPINGIMNHVMTNNNSSTIQSQPISMNSTHNSSHAKPFSNQVPHSTVSKSSSSHHSNITSKYPWRKGKWSDEEEAFTKKLIDAFNCGFLHIPTGTTLRSFLSDRLYCDPMRITKKFAGSSCIGKQVFTPADMTMYQEREKFLQVQDELGILEKRFLCKLEFGYSNFWTFNKPWDSQGLGYNSNHTKNHDITLSNSTSVSITSSISSKSNINSSIISNTNSNYNPNMILYQDSLFGSPQGMSLPLPLNNNHNSNNIIINNDNNNSSDNLNHNGNSNGNSNNNSNNNNIVSYHTNYSAHGSHTISEYSSHNQIYAGVPVIDQQPSLTYLIPIQTPSQASMVVASLPTVAASSSSSSSAAAAATASMATISNRNSLYPLSINSIYETSHFTSNHPIPSMIGNYSSSNSMSATSRSNTPIVTIPSTVTTKESDSIETAAAAAVIHDSVHHNTSFMGIKPSDIMKRKLEEDSEPTDTSSISHEESVRGVSGSDENNDDDKEDNDDNNEEDDDENEKENAKEEEMHLSKRLKSVRNINQQDIDASTLLLTLLQESPPNEIITGKHVSREV